MRAGHRINQLAGNANFPRCLAHRSLQNVAHAKPAPDLLDIDRSAFECEARIARNHKEGLEPRQRCNDLFDHPVREVFLFDIAAHVFEWQHRDRWLVWAWWVQKSVDQCTMHSPANSKGAHRLGDILELLLASIFEANVQLGLDFEVYLFGDK